MFLDRRDRGLRVFVSNDESDLGDFVESVGRIAVQRWVHVAVVRTARVIRLYLNGMLDSRATTDLWTGKNADDLYIGRPPWYDGECEFPYLLDNVKFFTRELSNDEIEIDSSGALDLMEPKQIRLSCQSCSIANAINGCPDKYHLCTTIELHSGGYQVAKINGWLYADSRVWSYEAQVEDTNDDVGVGICCLNLE